MNDDYNLEDENDDQVEDPEANQPPPSNGTPTSDAAASYIEPVSGRLRRMVYGYITEMGEVGATAQEVEMGSDWLPRP